MIVILFSAALIFLLTLSYLIFYLRLKLKNNRKKIKLLLFNNRLSRIRTFENISENILRDILEALKELNGSYEQVYAITPLLFDIRKYGEQLLAQRRFYHRIFFPDSEQRLTYKIRRLHQAENFIKCLSGNQRKGRNNVSTSVLRKVGGIS